MIEFPWRGVELLRELEANNNRDWYGAHKAEFTAAVVEPSEAMFGELKTWLNSETGVAMTGKMFRVHRDVRFSKDKTPYNPHVRFSIWPAGTDGPSFMFSLETDQMVVGAGQFEFAGRLAAFRQRLEEFAALLGPGLRLDEPGLKKVPAGWPSDAAFAEHLRRKFVAVWIDRPWPAGQGQSVSPEDLRRLLPIWRWIATLPVGSDF